MSIGTAKPTREELGQVPHHFVGHKSIQELFTAGQFEIEAMAKISELHETLDPVVMVGGSGMYARAVFEGLDDIPADLEIRAELNKKLESDGLGAILTQLKVLDPDYYNTVNKDNPQRVVRAVEASLASGKPYSTLRTASNKVRDFKILKIGLNMEREQLYARINERVDVMIESGLVDEAKMLYTQRHLNALNTVGYKELFAHFDGEGSLTDAISLIKRNTRRFAKRQLTWFKKEEGINWFDAHNTAAIFEYIDTNTNATASN